MPYTCVDVDDDEVRVKTEYEEGQGQDQMLRCVNLLVIVSS